MNVALDVAGVEGRYLHNFLPYVFSHLGLIGFVLSVSFFLFFLLNLLRGFRSEDLFERVICLYGLIFFVPFFALANLSASFTWIVIWFFTGFFGPGLTLTQSTSLKIKNT